MENESSLGVRSRGRPTDHGASVPCPILRVVAQSCKGIYPVDVVPSVNVVNSHPLGVATCTVIKPSWILTVLTTGDSRG